MRDFTERWQEDLTDLIFGFCAQEVLFDEHLHPCGWLYRDADGWWVEPASLVTW